jgi:NAD(P)-dependent dehydrogenase (short-subunit alcohol dehydrogenase family)
MRPHDDHLPPATALRRRGHITEATRTQPLQGKIALVTGASRGIGRAIAKALAADGATIAVHYGRNRASADAVVSDIVAQGGTAFAVGADLSQTQEAVKRLNDGGRIVSTTSIVTRTPFPAVAVYSMLKAPVDNLTKSLAVKLGGRGITVNPVAPGVIATDMAEFLGSPEGQEFAKSKQALKRIGQPEDVADVVAFLVGPRGRWVTGEVIEVGDGSGLVF